MNDFFAYILILTTLPGTIELTLLTIGAFFLGKKHSEHPAKRKVAVIIPAHNEERHLPTTLNSLKECEGRFDTWVVADHCSDRTVPIAKEAHAHVIERFHPKKKGKQHALNEAFKTLLQKEYDWFVVLDADSVVDSNFIVEILCHAADGAEAVQVQYGVLNIDDSIRTRLMHIAFLGFNFLRPRGRYRLGLSCGLLGNGFALCRSVLEKVPFKEVSIVEDLAYHLQLVENGVNVVFCEETLVLAQMPISQEAARVQRARWEGGRLRLILSKTPKLLKEIVFRRKGRLLEPLLDVLTLPLAYHVSLILLALFFASSFFYAFWALALTTLHIAAALYLGGGELRDLLALFYAPYYIAWKFLNLVGLVKTARRSDWQRSDRD